MMSGPGKPRRQRHQSAAACMALAGGLAFVVCGTARAETAARCDIPGSAKMQIKAVQNLGVVSVAVTRPGGAGRQITIEYGDEFYGGKLGPDGRATFGFAVTAPIDEFTISARDDARIVCSVVVPEFAKIRRAILRWHDPVQLDLNVLEPGGRYGDAGHVNGFRPNRELTQGVGMMDVISQTPADGTTAELSYVVPEASKLPAGAVFGYKVDYVSRGAQPEAAYCGDGRLATPPFEFITIEGGQVNSRKMTMNRVPCNEKVSDTRRYVPIR